MESPERTMPVGELLNQRELRLRLEAGGDGLERQVEEPAVQKPGLALAGHLESIHPERVQVIGYSEVSYIDSLSGYMADQRVKALCARPIPCIVVTRGLSVPTCLREACSAVGLPLLCTPLSSAEFINELVFVLQSWLGPSTSMHGVLVDVFGVGILILGRSGVGKSETALELVMHGHRLVADDIVEVRRRGPHYIYGSGPKIIKHHMEIRGLGIINVKDLFGISAVRDTKKIELVVELHEWRPNEEYDRLGVDSTTYEILGVRVPNARLPVRPGRNMTAIIEVAARNQLLKWQGHHSAREFQARLIRAIERSQDVPLLGSDVE